jgi:hypothetical protein
MHIEEIDKQGITLNFQQVHRPWQLPFYLSEEQVPGQVISLVAFPYLNQVDSHFPFAKLEPEELEATSPNAGAYSFLIILVEYQGVRNIGKLQFKGTPFCLGF